MECTRYASIFTGPCARAMGACIALCRHRGPLARQCWRHVGLGFTELQVSSAKVRHPEQHLVSVIVPAFNCAAGFARMANSFIAQTYGNWEMIVVEDRSSDDTLSVVQAFAERDKRISVIPKLVNSGPYHSKNLGMRFSKGSLITFSDCDDISLHQRLCTQVKSFLAKEELAAHTVSYVRMDKQGFLQSNRGRASRMSFMSMMFRRSVLLDVLGGFDYVKFAADAELYERLTQIYGRDRVQWKTSELYIAELSSGSLTNSKSHRTDMSASDMEDFLSPSRLAYVSAFMQWHKETSEVDALRLRFPMLRRPFRVPEVMIPPLGLRTDWVTASVASVPARKESLIKAVQSLAAQADFVNVYLNGYDSIPAELDGLTHVRVVLASSDEGHGDIGDAGKFAFLSDLALGYHFTFDDDIVYPPDYVERLLLTIRETNDLAIACVHGINIKMQQFQHYYELGSRQVYGFAFALNANTLVDICGTGTTAYATRTLPDLVLEDFFNPVNMADLWLAAIAKRKGIPMVSIRRGHQWLRTAETMEGKETLWAAHAVEGRSDSDQTALIEKHMPWGYGVRDSPRCRFWQSNFANLPKSSGVFWFGQELLNIGC
eukprot:m.204920 g.204920  ORF g.204920 m.204920 type:complete len:602 (+) comp10700_c0_seq4:810-2615(+)